MQNLNSYVLRKRERSVKKENKANAFYRNRQILNDSIFIEVLSNGDGYTTGKVAKTLNLRWDTVHEQLNRLHERGLITKTRQGASFLWVLHKEEKTKGCGYDV